jgi:hypothetical protein
MSDLDKASLVASGASIIPGYGALGALAVTGLDIAKDIQNTGKVDVTNLLTNIGFTGLSLVGLGGIGAATRAAKTAKVAQAALKTARAAKPVMTVAEVSKAKNLAGALGKIEKIEGVQTFKTLNISNKELGLLKEAGIVNKRANITTTVGKKTKEVAKEELVKLKTKFAKPITTSVTEKSLPEVLKLEKPLKYAGQITRTAAVLPLAMSVPRIAGQVIDDGFGNIQSEDLKNTLLLGAAGRKYFMDKKTAKNITSLIKTKTKGSYYDVKGTKLDTKEVAEMPKKSFTEKTGARVSKK